MSMAPVAAAISGNSSGATKSNTQSIAWPGPAMKPSSDIDLFTTTLPFPVLVFRTVLLPRTFAQPSPGSATPRAVRTSMIEVGFHRTSARSCSTPSHTVERNYGKTRSRRALRGRAGSRRGRRGRPVLQEPVLGAPDSKRRDCPGVRSVLFEVPEASMSAAAAMRLTWLQCFGTRRRTHPVRNPGQLERPSAELGSHSAQPVLQEALFGFAGRQGHCGVKFSSSLARVAKPTQVVRQGGVPQM